MREWISQRNIISKAKSDSDFIVVHRFSLNYENSYLTIMNLKFKKKMCAQLVLNIIFDRTPQKNVDKIMQYFRVIQYRKYNNLSHTLHVQSNKYITKNKCLIKILRTIMHLDIE